jgi:hypothetical protein
VCVCVCVCVCGGGGGVGGGGMVGAVSIDTNFTRKLFLLFVDSCSWQMTKNSC